MNCSLEVILVRQFSFRYIFSFFFKNILYIRYDKDSFVSIVSGTPKLVTNKKTRGKVLYSNISSVSCSSYLTAKMWLNETLNRDVLYFNRQYLRKYVSFFVRSKDNG